ncbi:hypothetical protein GCM10017559_41650 [Streptosporangium longisporum]|uniref:Uncharacterized protein n=1 Tax=Streptosporangium longisporum TaxID=46187 RepID=A0ABP6KNK2_9ACTN
MASALRADATALRAARRGACSPAQAASTPRVCATLLFLLFLMGLSLTAGLIVISIAIFLSSMSG